MQIDWVTVAAQIVNLLVLVWLLQRFLYGPITRAMNRREQRIENRLKEAEEKRQEAQEEAERLRKKQSELEDRREAILNEAREEAKALREKLHEEAREETNELRRSWHHQIAEEKEEFLRELRLRTAHHVYDLARSALAELADAELDSQVAARFAEHLKNMNRKRIKKLVDSIEEGQHGLLIQSDFELSPGAKRQITKVVHETVAEALELTYALSDDLLLGIRLVANGQTVEWSLSRYFERLEDAVKAKLAETESEKEQEAA